MSKYQYCTLGEYDVGESQLKVLWREGKGRNRPMMENFFGLMKNELLYVNHFNLKEKEFEWELEK